MGNANSSEKGKGRGKFSGSAIVNNVSSGLCGNIEDVQSDDEDAKKDMTIGQQLWECVASPINSPETVPDNRKRGEKDFFGVDEDEEDQKSAINPTSALFAAALVNEVADEEQVAEAKRKKQQREQEKAAAAANASNGPGGTGKHKITIGLALSRRHPTVGHPNTVTRQTAFDFNELQDREYKYVSSTDPSGWLAGGGEPGSAEKTAAPDIVHIPIIHLHADNQAVVDRIISDLARGEVFIPHMAILPEALSVSGDTPPDLVVRFGCERNDDVPPEEWPNWCLEFMHNQLYEYFSEVAGAEWTERPFQITLAKNVRWATVKHMNRYFARAERTIDAWREGGPRYLDPELAYEGGGPPPEEMTKPHGLYLLQNGVPTNYFAPNLEPPYTTKMTRSLLINVLGKSWDKKRREWKSEPAPKVITPASLAVAMCDCADVPGSGPLGDKKSPPVSPPTQEFTDMSMNNRGTVELREEKKMEEVRAVEPPKEEIQKSEQKSSSVSVSNKEDSGANQGLLAVATDGEDTLFDDSMEDQSPTKSASSSVGMSSMSASKKSSEQQQQRVKQIPLSPSSESASESKNAGGGPGSKYLKLPTKPLASNKSEAVRRTDSDSGLSLDYSVDSSLLAGGGESLLGQHFHPDGSVVGNASVTTSPVAASSRHEPVILGKGATDAPAANEEEDISLQPSTSSSIEPIPTDEELYEIGWAKALDPSSGNYYFFTLDRSKTVWENPLVGSQAETDTGYSI
eukprot:CAMPEP_0195282548 /NCGR_PEP_ID=MMETSP0707-20130614/1364_1 /TAXON_ID=33640 /ORGANISM="Asterionellopsis glacialis, Strain CCMP134" /LENGTH=741 /DNA_ID=CAMNT_0040341523 /DNA_START=253 /DNA_END=2478 /DNA_ORIENTATION=-